MEEEDTGGGFGRTGGLGGWDAKEAVRSHTLATNIVRHLHLYRMKCPRFGPHNSPLVSSKISQDVDQLMRVDYRVRTQIKEYLEINYSKNQNQPFAAHIAFHLAFCYHIGLGFKSNDNICHVRLDNSDKQHDDLKAEEKAVQPAR